MGIDKDKNQFTLTAELRRRKEGLLRAKTAGLHLPRTEEPTLRFGQVRRWLDGEGQS